MSLCSVFILICRTRNQTGPSSSELPFVKRLQALSAYNPPQLVEHFLTLAAFLGPARVNESLFRFHHELQDPPPDWCEIFTTSCRSEDDSSSSDAEEEVDRQEHMTRDQPAKAENT